MSKVKSMVFISLLIALEIIFTRFLAIQTPIIRIGFGFIPISIAGIMFGPSLAGLCAAIADLLGMILFPKGAYFPGFTLSAFLSGMIYGKFFYKRTITLSKIILCVLTISITIDLFVNTYWLSIITGKAVFALLVPRIIKTLIMCPVHIIIIYMIYQLLTKSKLILD